MKGEGSGGRGREWWRGRVVERGSGGEREWWREGAVESEEERGGVGSGGGGWEWWAIVGSEGGRGVMEGEEDRKSVV